MNLFLCLHLDIDSDYHTHTHTHTYTHTHTHTHTHTANNSVKTEKVVWKSYRKRWMIGTDGETESKKSLLATRLNVDDDDEMIEKFYLTHKWDPNRYC